VLKPAAPVGRAGELDAIEHFLDQPRAGWSLLVVEGEPGIGKTTVRRAGLDRAALRELPVLACARSRRRRS
jgi:predicted ATPase